MSMVPPTPRPFPALPLNEEIEYGMKAGFRPSLLPWLS
jgi:hypothetical protein